MRGLASRHPISMPAICCLIMQLLSMILVDTQDPEGLLPPPTRRLSHNFGRMAEVVTEAAAGVSTDGRGVRRVWSRAG